MLFWIFVILLVVGVALLVVDEVCRIWSDILSTVGVAIASLSTLAAILSLVIIVANNVTSDGFKASSEERYKALIYKAQTEQIRDEFGIVNKSFIDEIQYWNEGIAKGKALQRDFWIGIYYPNIYDDFETIDIDSFTYRDSSSYGHEVMPSTVTKKLLIKGE